MSLGLRSVVESSPEKIAVLTPQSISMRADKAEAPQRDAATGQQVAPGGCLEREECRAAGSCSSRNAPTTGVDGSCPGSVLRAARKINGWAYLIST